MGTPLKYIQTMYLLKTLQAKAVCVRYTEGSMAIGSAAMTAWLSEQLFLILGRRYKPTAAAAHAFHAPCRGQEILPRPPLNMTRRGSVSNIKFLQ